MKIKRNVKACGVPLVSEMSVMQTAPTCKYEEALCSIKCAIESLACIAEGDQVAKDSIANLSVVMMDLKGNC